MTTHEITVAIAGRLGVWHRRTCVDQDRAVWVAWVSHPRHGTLGIYSTDTEQPDGRRTRRQVTGIFAPIRVMAQDDDPRTVSEFTQAPLLLHVTDTLPWTEEEPPESAGGQLLVGPAVWQSHRYIAPARNESDLYVVARPGQHTSPVWSWQRLYGVIHTVEKWRYLRYLALPAQEVYRG